MGGGAPAEWPGCGAANLDECVFIYGHEASSDVISGYSTVERSGACFELQLFVR